MKWATLLAVVALAAGAFPLGAQDRPPVIDMHLHAHAADAEGPPPIAICAPFEDYPVWDQRLPYDEAFLRGLKQPACAHPLWSPTSDEEVMRRTIDVMKRHNVYGVLGGTPERVAAWMKAAPGRFYPGLDFALDPDAPSPAALRSLHESGGLAVLAEVLNAYAGIPPTDPRMEPYWTLAEELDIPVGIHVGPGPMGVAYLGAEGFRARLQSALTLEDTLVRHPRLRVYLMHAGFPMLDDLLALLYAYPQVYLDLGTIVFAQPRASFYAYLQNIVQAGFGKRVMFGSDQMVWPEAIERGIASIEGATFLSPTQRRDILYDNAARFLRLGPEEIARQHGRPAVGGSR